MADAEDGAVALQAAIERVKARLAKLASHYAMLVSLVGHQTEHLKNLRRRAAEGQVVFLPDYREMKMQRVERQKEIASTQVNIDAMKAELKTKSARLAALQPKDAEPMGVLIPMRKP